MFTETRKTIDVKVKYVRKQVERNFIDLKWINGNDNVANILTKALPAKIANAHGLGMGPVDYPAGKTALARFHYSGAIATDDSTGDETDEQALDDEEHLITGSAAEVPKEGKPRRRRRCTLVRWDMRSLRRRERQGEQQEADNQYFLGVGVVVVLLVAAVTGYYLYATGKLDSMLEAPVSTLSPSTAATAGTGGRTTAGTAAATRTAGGTAGSSPSSKAGTSKAAGATESGGGKSSTASGSGNATKTASSSGTTAEDSTTKDPKTSSDSSGGGSAPAATTTGASATLTTSATVPTAGGTMGPTSTGDGGESSTAISGPIGSLVAILPTAGGRNDGGDRGQGVLVGIVECSPPAGT
ncbi:hypothetical protein JCM3770_002916 [Rhodotorula araucariae]